MSPAKRDIIYNWLKKDQLELQKMLEDKEKKKNDEEVENTEEKKKTGRQKLLNGIHKQYLLEQTFNEDSPTTLDQALEGLIAQFEVLKVFRATVHKFIMTEDCALSLKKSIFLLYKEKLF
jgi:hypothetical protein